MTVYCNCELLSESELAGWQSRLLQGERSKKFLEDISRRFQNDLPNAVGDPKTKVAGAMIKRILVADEHLSV